MQLEDVLCDLFPSDDPLDAKDFNVTGKVQRKKLLKFELRVYTTYNFYS